MKKHLYIETWGCQMNLHQSEGIVGLLEEQGLSLTDSLDDADVVIFNTCLVRQKAEEKVYGRIGAVAQLKKEKDVLFGIGGCLPQVRKEHLLKRFPTIDFLFGSSNLAGLPALIAEVEEEKRRIARLPEPMGIDEIDAHRTSTVTAMVTITQGCSNFCSYCIVPYARGPLRSRAPENVLAEVEALVQSGYPEILLLGQNVDSYGRDRPEYGDFADLLDRVARTEIPRIRFTSSHPHDMTLRVIERIAEHENICNHIHLACQSGSDRILKEMNRGYTSDEFLAIITAARGAIPRVNITTDLIVGYPGENEADFRESLDLIEEARFGSIFVAKYSPRPGTRSAELPDDVPQEVKNARLQEVLARQRTIALEENRRQIGRRLTILVEGKRGDGAFYGRADDHRTVVLPETEKACLGEFIPVRIEEASAGALIGKRVLPVASKGAL
jgi:tRNA-2-methylthio-N6-dimethylallyladenosine synthase